jgi:hypothetical protein
MNTVIQESTIERPSWAASIERPSWATTTDYDPGVHEGEVRVGEFVVWLSQAFDIPGYPMKVDSGLVEAWLPGDTASGTVLPPANPDFPGGSSAAQCRGLAAALLKAAEVMDEFNA